MPVRDRTQGLLRDDERKKIYESGGSSDTDRKIFHHLFHYSDEEVRLHCLLLILMSSRPPKPTSAEYVRMLNEDQQVINKLTAENKALRNELYGPPGSKVYPRFQNEKPFCPVPGFNLKWEVKDNSFVAYCVREP